MHPTTETETMTTTKPTTRRIYVACLAAYNAGKLHGAWIDTGGKDADELEREVIDRVMLTSPEPNVMRCEACGATNPNPNSTCLLGAASHERKALKPSSEEWAIHDTDGFKGMIGEHDTFARVAMISALLEDHDPEVVAYAITDDGAGKDADQSDVERWIEDRYAGAWDSLEDFAQSDVGPGAILDALEDPSGREFTRKATRKLGEMPFGCATLAAYIDWEKVGRDLELNGDVFTVEAKGGGVHVFWNR